ncbi:putative serine/threonine-protein kinase [Frankliniella fusca]|uniref:Serine/threonine-protein kinase n=1 Tax=Frankliniella fusca TaxID=407009 RepID=A0AAE1GWU3_9NEOP|nr:putative serine/threonine-protein kinase [Frankliniella fusca]KAK3910677.1 putative serine/threonine-protein kinase [Frankliniella fusca]
MMLSYQPRSLVSAIRPDANAYVPSQKRIQVNDMVWVRLSSKHQPFVGKVVKVIGPTLVHVSSQDKVIQVRTNQLKLARLDAESPVVASDLPNDVTPISQSVCKPKVLNPNVSQQPKVLDSSVSQPKVVEPNVQLNSSPIVSPSSPTVSSRNRARESQTPPERVIFPSERVLRPRDKIVKPLRFR